MYVDTDILIAGAGMSGLGLAIQLVRQFGTRSFELIEKADGIGGTWKVNTYPGCGCDVPSKKYSLQPEIQDYFRSVADQYKIVPHIRFSSTVETAAWEEKTATWLVYIKDLKDGTVQQRRCKIFVSAVGSLSVPKECEMPGADRFKGRLFHSASWDHSFDWENKDVVVLGNGCSATQFVPVLANGSRRVHKLTQFARQAHFLAERIDFSYSSLFKSIMRYVPLAMRLYRAKLYADMEKDFAGFDIATGAKIREDLKEENRAYVERMAPKKYVEALIPQTAIGCKRKVLDAGYLACLHSENMELITDDPVREIVEDGLVTDQGHKVKADAIVLATGFATHQMLFPMQIQGRDSVSLNEYVRILSAIFSFSISTPSIDHHSSSPSLTLQQPQWANQSHGAPHAYLGTCIPSFPNFFILMGPNTVTGHLSVIYTVECQINFTLRLLAPILRPRSSFLSSLPSSSPATSVSVTSSAARADDAWTQTQLRRFVWASGCSSWALHPESGRNFMMYPDWQFRFWWRSVWVRWGDFEYGYGKEVEGKQKAKGVWSEGKRAAAATAVVMAAGLVMLRRKPMIEVELNGIIATLRAMVWSVVRQTRELVKIP
ncbi:MAG: hypothetical protein M1821_007607 [Bathelium mastoideum]|nr:MAG: hypothetical protein M1821_007607 [Bathelium mastoideum]